MNHSRLPLLLGAVIVLLGLLSYGNSFAGAFVFDDVRTIERGNRIRQDLWPPGPIVRRTRRPLLFYSLAVNYQLGGLNPRGYHVFNVAIHFGAALLLFGIVRRTLLLPRFGQQYESSAPWLAFAVAAIWVVHPLQTQAVNYVIQRCESVASFCMLLVLYGLVRAVNADRPWVWYAIAVGGVWVGVGFKETVIVAPLLGVLYDRVFLSESWEGVARRRWPVYLAMAPAWLWLAYASARGVTYSLAGDVSRRKPVTARVPVANRSGDQRQPAKAATETSKTPQRETVTSWEYARSQPGVILHYLKLVLWPQPLCLDYRWPVATIRAALLPGLIVVGLLVLSLVALVRWPPIGFVSTAFFLLLAPTSSLLPIYDLAFEHRMYLASAAAIILLVFAALGLMNLVVPRTRWSQTTARRILGALLCVTLIVLTLGTHIRNRDYHSRVAIWSSVLQVRPQNVRAMNNLAQALIKEEQIAEALVWLQRAEALNPSNPATNGALGELLLQDGHPREAMQRFERALASWPKNPVLHVNMGAACEKLGLWDAAIFHARKAVRHGPGIAAGYHLLGNALVQTGKADEAITAYQQALRRDPDYYDAHTNLGAALASHGRLTEGIRHFERAVALRPNVMLPYENLSMAYADAGRYGEAITAATRAAELADRAGQVELARQLRGRVREYEAMRRAGS